MKAKLCFFDDYYIASRPGTLRRYFQPQKLGLFEDPEARLQTYTSFFYDPLVKKFRLYYEIPSPAYQGTEIRSLMLAEADTVEEFLQGTAAKMPVTGLDEHGVHGCSVVLNEHAADPEKRYVLVGNFHADDRKKRCLAAIYSADGKHFQPMRRIWHDYSDTYNSVYYNPYSQEYVATTRPALMDRRVSVMRSRDLEHWSDPEIILHPATTGAQNMGVQYYAMGVSHLDGIFYGILWRFMTDLGQPDFLDMNGYMEADLYYSHDGIHFDPTGLSPMCNRLEPPAYGCKQLWLLNITDDGKGHHVICGGASKICHGASYSKEDGKFCTTILYQIRRDGYCALEGFSEKSTVYTKPVLFEGGEIRVNCNALSGSLTVALLNADGTPIEGFGFEDCIPITRQDSIEDALRWKEHNTDELTGKRIRLAFRLDGVLLYSVSLDAVPCLRHPQISFNDPRAQIL